MKRTPIICIVGRSKSGKTLFIETLIPEIKKRGLRVATMKHDIHDRFEMDKPGKDTWRHKRAGSVVSIISSPKRIGMIMDVDHDHDPEEILRYIDTEKIDLVIAEGYKGSSHPKIEVLKDKADIMCKDDPNLIAIISDQEMNIYIPQFKRNQIREVANFIIKKLGL